MQGDIDEKTDLAIDIADTVDRWKVKHPDATMLEILDALRSVRIALLLGDLEI